MVFIPCPVAVGAMRHHALQDDDPHRLTCPAGHSSWKPIDGHFWCPRCERNSSDRMGAFERVVDQLTGDELDRGDVRELERELAGDEGAAV